MTMPGPASQLIKLLPIAFVPSVHRTFLRPFLDAARALEGSISPLATSFGSHDWDCGANCTSYSLQAKRAKKFLCLVFQTRKLARCFGQNLCSETKHRNKEPERLEGPICGMAPSHQIAGIVHAARKDNQLIFYGL
jgi:hypothetical protein